MTWNPANLNTKSRLSAVLSPQDDPKKCAPYWWRGTDHLVPVVIQPIKVENGNVLVFQAYDSAKEQLLAQTNKVALDDDDGSTIFTDIPSTVMEWVRNQKANQYCLALFTREFAFTTLKWPSSVQVVEQAGGGNEGKWPRTAGLGDNAQLLRILDDVSNGKPLSPIDMNFLKRMQQLLRSR